jgi:PAS domain S-box-containing protein
VLLRVTLLFLEYLIEMCENYDDVDVSQRRQAEVALTHRIEQLDALICASQTLTRSLDLEQVMSEIIALTYHVVPSDYTSVLLVDQAGHIETSLEDFHSVPSIIHRVRDEGITRWILQSQRPILVDLIQTDGAMIPPPPEGAPRCANPYLVHAGIQSIAGLPMIVKDEVVGVLYLHSRQPERFRGQRSLLMAFANQVAIAVENARLYETARRDLADRRRAEEALAASERFLQNIFDAIQDGISVIDKGLRVLRVNRKMEERHAHALPLVGRKCYEVYHQGRSRPCDPCPSLRAMEQKMPQTEVIAWERPDDQPGWLEVYAFPLFDGAGEIAGVVEYVRDITERKRTQEELTWLSLAVKMTADSVVISDLEGRIIDVNEATLEMYGIEDKSELIGRNCFDLIAPYDHPRALAGLAETLEQGAVQLIQYDILNAQGEVIALEMSASLLEVDGEPKGFVATSRDITERKQAEIELRRRTAQLEALREVGLEIAAQLDLDALLHSVVSRAVELLEGTSGALFLYQPQYDQLELVVSIGPNLPPLKTRLRSGEGLAGKVWERKVPLRVDDYRAWEGRAAVMQDYPSAAIMGVPIHWGAPEAESEFLGVLDVLAEPPRTFSPSDVELLSLFATRAAIAIRNAQLYEELRQRSLEQETVGHIARALNTLDVQEAFPVLVTGLRAITDCDEVMLALLEASGSSMRVATLQHPFPLLSEGRLMPLSNTAAAEDVMAGRPHLTADLHAEIGSPVEQRLYQMGFRSRVNLPLLVGDSVIGALNLASEQPDFFTEDQLPVLQQIADTLAVAVQNTRLFRAEREQRELAEALEEAAAAVNMLDFEHVLDRILEQVARIVVGDVYSVLLVEDDNTVRVARWRGYDQMGIKEEQIVDLVIPLAAVEELQHMIGAAEPLVTSDLAANYSEVLPDAWSWIHAHVGAPIQVTGVTVGFLSVASAQIAQFSAADARRLKALAVHAATAIENAGLYRKLQRHAEELEANVQERTAQLQAHSARLDAILSSVADGIVVTDAEGNIVQANAVAQAWLTQSLAPAETAALRAAVQDLVHRVMMRDESESHPSTLLELATLDLELTGAPISGMGTDRAAAVVDIHEVTHLKALERMKALFVANVSHELRSPIATIQAYVHLLQHTLPEELEQCHRYLKALAQAAEHQVALGEDILRIARIHGGRVSLMQSSVDVNTLVKGVLVKYQPLADKQGLTLMCRLAQPSPNAWIDEVQILQVLSDLAEDAIHYAPPGGKVLVSTACRERDNQSWVVISVSDTGELIAEDDLPFVFERFFRDEEPTTPRVSETGLHLMIVKGIVELHGGYVTVESPSAVTSDGGADVGNTFSLWLPSVPA